MTPSIPRLALLSALTTTLLACSSVPPAPQPLVQARSALGEARNDTLLQTHAAAELAQAQASLRRAEEAQSKDEGATRVEHHAYLAQQRLRVAQATASHRADQLQIAAAGTERERMRLAARTQEADRAQRDLQASQQAAQQAQAAQQRQQASTTAALNDANAQLNEADRRAQASAARADTLEQQLMAMQGQGSPAGVVITLGDLLFASGSHELDPAGSPRMRQLATLMREHPERSAVIGGYTDSQGDAESNLRLSDRRAQQVMATLIGLGVSPMRLRAQGHGEALPVADNNTSSGRQMNRRVEVVFAQPVMGARAP